MTDSKGRLWQRDQQACGNCRFVSEVPPLKNPNALAHCLRHAPQPTQNGRAPVSYWPIVEFDDWCGEWKPRTEGKAS
jgi:hypothetical protein